MSHLSAKHFHSEKAAYAFVEARVWPDGPVCPHCGCMSRIGLLKGKSTRIGVRKCYDCRKPFTVKVGTIFESSHIPLNVWLQAMHLMASSKKGISANQVSRALSVTLRTAWFMMHRIREAMKDGSIDRLGGSGKIVEADETYYGKPAVPPTKRTDGSDFLKPKKKGRNSRPIVALVERGGRAKVFHVKTADKETIQALLVQNIDLNSRLHTDESRLYKGSEATFAAHETVRHGRGEFARGDVTTNSAEGFFGVFKRGMRGIYQHCAETHLHRYINEFSFRYNSRSALGTEDVARTSLIVKGITGRRLTYQTLVSRSGVAYS